MVAQSREPLALGQIRKGQGVSASDGGEGLLGVRRVEALHRQVIELNERVIGGRRRAKAHREEKARGAISGRDQSCPQLRQGPERIPRIPAIPFEAAIDVPRVNSLSQSASTELPPS